MSPSAVEIVTIRVLGGFRVECGGETVPAGQWSRPSARRLLKALALADGGRMHRSRLAALLWPRADQVSAARSLRVTLHAVRRALEPDLPSRAPSSYVVSGEDGSVVLARGRVRVDLIAVRDEAAGARPHELHRLVRTLLPELLPDDDHEPFVRAAREAHRELRRTLAVACARQGRVAAPGAPGEPPDESLDDVLREVLLADPLAADVCRVLLERLIASSRHGEAVQRYHAHRGALVDSCGTEPDRPLRDLFALAVSAPFPTAPTDGDLPRFVGREAELAMLTALPVEPVPRSWSSRANQASVCPGPCPKPRPGSAGAEPMSCTPAGVSPVRTADTGQCSPPSTHSWSACTRMPARRSRWRTRTSRPYCPPCTGTWRGPTVRASRTCAPS